MSAPEPLAADSRSRSRRALLAGALGGVGAWALGVFNRPAAVRAEGQAVAVGGEYGDATSVTAITNASNDADVIKGQSNAFGAGVVGISNTGAGVRGQSTSNYGVTGSSPYAAFGAFSVGGTGYFASVAGGRGVDANTDTGIGVRAVSVSGTGLDVLSNSGTAIVANSSSGKGMAVFADEVEAIDAQSLGDGHPTASGWHRGGGTGLLGLSTPLAGTLPPIRDGVGVHGHTTISGGTGVRGTAPNGYAFWGRGRLKFEEVSGVAVIAAGTTTKVVTPGVSIGSGSFVLLTPRANLGGRDLWFTVNAAADTFTIHMSSSRGSGTSIAWLLLS